MYMCSLIEEAAPPFAVSKRDREIKRKMWGIWTMCRSGGGEEHQHQPYCITIKKKWTRNSVSIWPGLSRVKLLSLSSWLKFRFLSLDPISTLDLSSMTMNRENLLRNRFRLDGNDCNLLGQSLIPWEERDRFGRCQKGILERGLCREFLPSGQVGPDCLAALPAWPNHLYRLLLQSALSFLKFL